jgi:hypothetical protein
MKYPARNAPQIQIDSLLKKVHPFFIMSLPSLKLIPGKFCNHFRIVSFFPCVVAQVVYLSGASELSKVNDQTLRRRLSVAQINKIVYFLLSFCCSGTMT